ncbi:glycosyltransferase family 39 protein [Alphaproteobacteria bacterium]|nr:glycosyltransferase family 39 protein [Alphaproteobacteria bacterium]
MIMLNQSKAFSYLNFFIILSFTILLLRIILNIHINLPLHFDEAQYWDWSQNLDWGYFSKPPLLAFLIRVVTELCGDGENCIRSLSPFLHFLTSLIIFYSVHLLTKSFKKAFLGSILYLLMPGISFSSFLISTDVPLLLFSSLIALCIIKISNSRKNTFLLFCLLGLFFALGFLSKYAIFYLLLSFLFSILIDKECRRFFFNKSFLLSIIIIIILIFPNLIWNYNNEFVTLSHTASNANLSHIKINIFQGITFLLSQIFIFGVIPFLFLFKKTLSLLSLNTIQKILLITFILPIFIVFLLAIFSRANANWAVVGYPFACILLPTLLNSKKNFMNNMFILNQLTFSTIIVISIFFLPIFNLDPFSNIKHIKPLSNIIKNEIINRNNIALMTDDREDYAQLLYYLKNIDIKKAKWNGDIKIDDHYELTTDHNDLKGYDVLLVTRTRPTPTMEGKATSTEKVNSFNFKTNKRLKTFNLYILKNWK